jgi:hypothetical protein
MDLPEFDPSSKSESVISSLAAYHRDTFDPTARIAISPKEKSRVVARSDNRFNIGAMTVQVQTTVDTLPPAGTAELSSIKLSYSWNVAARRRSLIFLPR